MKMKGFISLLLFTLANTSIAQNSASYDKVLNTFSNRLYRIYAESESDSILFSPYSIHAVLSMLYQGSDGTTRNVLSQVLGTSQFKNPKDLASIYHKVINEIDNIANVTLNAANKMYISKDVQLSENFNSIIKSEFLSEIDRLNFVNDKESIDVINKWVEKKTNNKIKQLLNPADVTPRTKLVMVNAIYFKGQWNLKFDGKLTKSEPFYNYGLVTAKKNVEIMHQLTNYPYAHLDDLEAQVIEIPYKDNKVKLVVILPNKRDGLKELEAKLTGERLSEVLQSMYVKDVQLGLPKFRIASEIDLSASLQRMGLGEIFDGSKANFTKALAGRDELYVSKAKQRAMIEVSEEGSEASAATFVSVAIPISANYEPPPPAIFQVDHPFIFLITAKFDDDHRSSRILFHGRVTSL